MRQVMAGSFGLAAGLLAVDAFFVEDNLVPGARWALFAAATLSGLGWIATSKPIRPRLPMIRVEKAGPGVGVRFLPPDRAGVRRLKTLTDDLVTEIHEYLKTAPGLSSIVEGHFDKPRARREATSEDELNQMAREGQKHLIESLDQERRELGRRFGGRVEYLLTEYQDRGLITEDEKSKLLWQLGSSHWLVDLVRKLEAMRLQL